jgi:ribosomal-protein-alanine N-acetyltransferase
VALLEFEVANRVYSTRSVPDCGDGYVAGSTQWHAALFAGRASGLCHFRVVVDGSGALLGRFTWWMSRTMVLSSGSDCGLA